MKNNDSLSFAIVTHNNQDQIVETLLSLIDAVDNMWPYEVFIIDNESTDETVERINEMNFEFVHIISSKNRGFGFGHNAVLNRLNSTYHFIVNPDICLKDKKSLSKMIEYMNFNREVGMLSPLILNEDGSIQHLFRKKPTVLDAFIRFAGKNVLPERQKNFINLNSGYNKILPIENASGSFMLIRTNIFKEVKGFDERFFMYYEDSDLTRKVNEISTAMFVPTVSVVHKWERANKKNIKYSLIMIGSLYKYMRKWGWSFW